MSLQTKSKKLDMLNGPIWNKLPQYALPVAATGILEQLFNASDLAIVGNFASTDRTVAIAAVGANSPVIGVILNLFIGLSLGTNVVIANAIGRGDKKQVEQAVHTSVVASFLGGVLVALLVYYTFNSFSQACTTFVGQNFGAGKINRCKRTPGPVSAGRLPYIRNRSRSGSCQRKIPALAL